MRSERVTMNHQNEFRLKNCWLFNLINTSRYACKSKAVKPYSPRLGPCACISSRITTVIQVGKKENKETIK